MSILIIGPQACGKGTQAQLLAKKFDGIHLEMGQILRDIAQQDTPRGRMISEINKRKELAPDHLAMEVLKESLQKIPINKLIIFDGVPRTKMQIKPTEKLLAELGREIKKVVYITLPREDSVARITKRYNCTVCGRRLILGEDIKSAKDSCPTCGGLSEQRGDDTPDGIQKRLDTFYAMTLPVVQHYKKKGLVLEVDGQKSVGEVYNEIMAGFDDSISYV